MSYDIRICVKTEMPNKWGNQFVVIDSPEYDSPTYNLRDMFVACMEWDYNQGEFLMVKRFIGMVTWMSYKFPMVGSHYFTAR